ncbi:DUF2959 domain-containing protein [Agaribacter marinus]|uniref:DUF2959 domain-containing protein n=1 Tax=Agaribacter marinus TaxID=1431249 RepID=A0AA37WJL4_9ALTE|nr:DUF2959 domain-containing protein [Agaribacter marinus]GLR72378.1 DUF2959 domain-containing protein [Agaribacter marinus]
MRKSTVIISFLLLALSGCTSTIQDTYFNMWEKLGVEKRDILVDRVEDAQETQQEAQQQFSSALEEFSALINFDGGELEDVYNNLNDQFEASKSTAEDVSNRIDKVESVAGSLFREWESELEQITNQNLRRDSQKKLSSTKRNYESLVRSMRKVEASMAPVLSALQDNVLYLKHNLNANAVGALKGELNTIQKDVKDLIAEMSAAIKQSDEFIATIKS